MNFPQCITADMNITMADGFQDGQVLATGLEKVIAAVMAQTQSTAYRQQVFTGVVSAVSACMLQYLQPEDAMCIHLAAVNTIRTRLDKGERHVSSI